MVGLGRHLLCLAEALYWGSLSGNKEAPYCQRSMLWVPVVYRADGYRCLADIVVATPGRLVDHIDQTQGFSLQQLRFLVGLGQVRVAWAQMSVASAQVRVPWAGSPQQSVQPCPRRSWTRLTA